MLTKRNLLSAFLNLAKQSLSRKYIASFISNISTLFTECENLWSEK
jgi:hypothetical protein